MPAGGISVAKPPHNDLRPLLRPDVEIHCDAVKPIKTTWMLGITGALILSIFILLERIDAPVPFVVHARPAAPGPNQLRDSLDAHQKQRVSSTVVVTDSSNVAERRSLRTWALPTNDSAFSAFAEWTERYRNAAPDSKSSLEPEGIALARVRREALRSAIQLDPANAIELAAP